MNVELKKEGTKLTIIPNESIDSKTAPELENTVNGTITDDVNELLFIMDGVDFISSAGIRVLLALRKKIGNGKVTLQNINNSVKEVLKLSALTDYFVIC